MKIAVLIARILLGLIYLVFGLNFFFHFSFLNMPVPKMSPAAAAFSGGLFGTGYFFQYMKALEIISGVFLLINRYTAFFLLVLLPISLNIALFHFILVPSGAPMGAAVIVLNVFLCIAYLKYYTSVFTQKPTL